MIVTGECTSCRRTFIARGERDGRGERWTMEPSTFPCDHWSEAHDAIGRAVYTKTGRARVWPVRAQRDPGSTAWLR